MISLSHYQHFTTTTPPAIGQILIARDTSTATLLSVKLQSLYMAHVAPSWLSHAPRLVLAISLTGNLAYLLIPWTKLLELCPTYKCVGTMGIFRLPAELAPQDPDYEWLVRVLVGLLALLVGNEALKKWYRLAAFPRAANQPGAAGFYNRGMALTVFFGILVLLLPCLHVRLES